MRVGLQRWGFQGRGGLSFLAEMLQVPTRVPLPWGSKEVLVGRETEVQLGTKGWKSLRLEVECFRRT